MRRRAERLDLERERLGRRRQLGQPRRQREADPLRVGARLAQRDRRPPGAAGHEARRHRERPQRAAAPLAAGEHAGHEQLERPLELLARRPPRAGRAARPPARAGGAARAGCRARCARSSASRPGCPKRSATAREGSAASSPSVRMPSRSKHLGQRLPARAACAAARPAAARGSRAARRSSTTSRVPRRAAGGPAAPRRGRRSGWAPRRSARPGRAPGGRPPARPSRSPPCRPRRPADSKKAAPARSDSTCGADPLEPVEHRVPERAHALGVGRHEPQRRAARHRLAQPHAAHHAEGLGRRRHLPHHLLAPGLGRQRGRLGEQRPPVPESGQELEAGVEDADDHDRTHVRIRSGGVQGQSRGAHPGPGGRIGGAVGPRPKALAKHQRGPGARAPAAIPQAGDHARRPRSGHQHQREREEALAVEAPEGQRAERVARPPPARAAAPAARRRRSPPRPPAPPAARPAGQVQREEARGERGPELLRAHAARLEPEHDRRAAHADRGGERAAGEARRPGRAQAGRPARAGGAGAAARPRPRSPPAPPPPGAPPSRAA